MSVDPDPQGQIRLIEETRDQINYLVEKIARLSERDVPPAAYYAEYLQGLVTAIAAAAGAVWIRTSLGHLQLQYQINMDRLGLERDEVNRQVHDELLRESLQQGRPRLMPPHSGAGLPMADKPVAGNPTDFAILLAPILIDKQVAGLVEVWESADRSPEAMQGFLHFITQMAGLASRYLRNQQLRQMVGRQHIWTQLESFARQIHGSLNPTEVAYLVANEGRRLVECDRISVAVRRNKRPTIEAISGADVVEKRSSLVQLMRALCEQVLLWGEKLVYSGTKDDTLPPGVLKGLDAYLSESNSKLLVVLPLRDEREEENKKPPRSALVMECFEPTAAPEQLLAQLEVIGRHASGALYNAIEHRRIPMRWVWLPLARVQEGLGGKARAIVAGIGAALLVLVAAMAVVPYPLKMDAKGQLLPQQRRWIYTPVPARVEGFEVQPGSTVVEGQALVLMYDVDLEKRLIELNSEIEGAQQDIEFLNRQLAAPNEADRARFSQELKEKEVLRDGRIKERDALRERRQADDKRPGYFWLKAPLGGTVLNSRFQEELTNKNVKPSEPLLRIGDKDSPWEIELRIPQKHIGQVLEAFNGLDADAELDVDLLLSSRPERTYKGKLARNKIGGEASPNRDDNNESDPVVIAWVRINGAGIAESDQIPQDQLVTGVEVHSKIRCGSRAMGYSLFYGMWEFFYEKVVFYF
ncbi:MAG TPA: hypothetical protein VG013_36760 [Gemmataceae bacterium]|jgi:uncharacterized coiled-coil protein SlyX|nr:hypothetical protein [Gemmataceae bacterium]